MTEKTPWAGSDRRSRLPRDWNQLRQVVLKRDGGRCTWTLPSGARCPRPATDVDHRIPGDDHRLENLQALCSHHHGRKSAQEGVQARAQRKVGRKRRQEQHPSQMRRRRGDA